MKGKTVDLGWCVAKYDPPGTQGGQGPKLTILSPSDMDQQGGYQPAESIVIWSDAAIIALRNFLNEVLPVVIP